jgi:hypothetical protein
MTGKEFEPSVRATATLDVVETVARSMVVEMLAMVFAAPEVSWVKTILFPLTAELELPEASSTADSRPVSTEAKTSTADTV